MLARKRGSGGARGARSRVRCAAPKRRAGRLSALLIARLRKVQGDGDIYPVCHLSDLESDLSGHSCQVASLRGHHRWPTLLTLFSGKAKGSLIVSFKRYKWDFGSRVDSGSRAQRPARRSAPFQRGSARRKTYPRARWGPGRARRRRPSCVKCACARRGTIYIWLSARRGWRGFYRAMALRRLTPTPFPMQVPHGGRLGLRRHRVVDRGGHAVHDSPDERVRQRAVAEVLQAQKLQLVRAATQLLRGCTRDFTRGRGSPNGPGGAPARLSMRTRPDSTLSTTARPRSWAVSPAHPRNTRGAAVTPLVFNRFPPADRRVPLPRAQGFRKANNRFWAFANAHFRKDCEPHLVNIKRRQGAKAKADPGPSTGVRVESHARVTCFFHESF